MSNDNDRFKRDSGSPAPSLAEAQPAYPPLGRGSEEEALSTTTNSISKPNTNDNNATVPAANPGGPILTEKKSGEPLEIIHELADDDVLLGRGTGPNDHEGNVRFRDQIIKTQDSYVNSATRKEKTEIARKTIKYIKSRKGRFVRRLDKHEMRAIPGHSGDTLFCVVADEELLLEKTKQSFRHQIRKRSSTQGIKNNADHANNEIGRTGIAGPIPNAMMKSDPVTAPEQRIAAMSRFQQQDHRQMLPPNAGMAGGHGMGQGMSMSASGHQGQQHFQNSQQYPLGYGQHQHQLHSDSVRSRLSLEQGFQHGMHRQQQLGPSLGGYSTQAGVGVGVGGGPSGSNGGNVMFDHMDRSHLTGMSSNSGMGSYGPHSSNPHYTRPYHNSTLGAGPGMAGGPPQQQQHQHQQSHGGPGSMPMGGGIQSMMPRGGPTGAAGGVGVPPVGGAGGHASSSDMFYRLPSQSTGVSAAAAAAAAPYRRPAQSIKQTMINDAMALLRAAEQYEDYPPASPAPNHHHPHHQLPYDTHQSGLGTQGPNIGNGPAGPMY